MELGIVLLGLGLAFYIAWCIGTNDAANPTQMAVGSGALRINRAILLFALFAFIGASIQGWMVIKTFGKGIAHISTIYDALTATIATAIWITLSSYKGMPISTTQSSVGAVLGIGLFHVYLLGEAQGIYWGVLMKVFASWVTSPLGGMLLAAGLYFPFTKLAERISKAGKNPDKLFKFLVIAALAGSAYAFGSNDVGNATGVYYSILSSSGAHAGFDYRTALGL
ncbi:MAG: inorganic phosphate transporter, partial [Desulfurococcales archaeon]|nr:inorganic phosphate transporter [Desulfurococcales archaeon]